MMNPVVKERWIRDLRSRRYKQIRSKLRDYGNGRCCLVVLCDAVDPTRWHYESYWVDKSLSEVEIPRTLRNALGISVDAQNELIKMNDQEKLSFRKIALWIEKNL